MSMFGAAAAIEARARMNYRVDFWVSSLLGFVVEVAVVWILWTAIFAESKAVKIVGFDASNIYLYYFLVVLFAKVTQGDRAANDTADDIYQGRMNKYILMPVRYLGFKYAQYLGRMAPAFIQFVLFGIALATVLRMPPSVDITAGSILMCLVSLALANILFFLIDMLVQLCAFWLGSVSGLLSIKLFVATLLGGYLLPIAMFPERVRAVIDVLPFRHIYGTPVTTLMGHSSLSQWMVDIALASGWCLALYLACQLAWFAGKSRYSGVGI